jgi:hypothetical protein
MVNSAIVRHDFSSASLPTQDMKIRFLLVLASTVILGFRSRRYLRPRDLYSPRHVRVSKWGLLIDGGGGGGSVFLRRRYVCSTAVSAQTAKLLLALASMIIFSL